MSAKQIHEYIERLSNLLRNEARSSGAEYGLLPIQIEALHYLSICNRYSDTPMGVTEYLGLTKGSVSQSLKVLEREGFLSKKPDRNDKRITHLRVSKAGRALLRKEIPAPLFINACERLDQKSQAQISNRLEELLRAIQRTNNMKTFGVCHTCQYNQTNDAGNGHLCGLTQESLSSADIQLICREHITRPQPGLDHGGT
jgi:DNA-binding MarR family transcriptional regulator